MVENKNLEKYTLCLGYLSREGIASSLAENGKEMVREIFLEKVMFFSYILNDE